MRLVSILPHMLENTGPMRGLARADFGQMAGGKLCAELWSAS